MHSDSSLLSPQLFVLLVCRDNVLIESKHASSLGRLTQFTHSQAFLWDVGG